MASDNTFRYAGNEDIEWVRLAAADLRFAAGRTAAVIRSNDVLAALDSEFRGTRLEDAELSFVKLHFKLRGAKGRPRAITLTRPARSVISRNADVIEAYLRQEGVLLA